MRKRPPVGSLDLTIVCGQHFRFRDTQQLFIASPEFLPPHLSGYTRQLGTVLGRDTCGSVCSSVVLAVRRAKWSNLLQIKPKCSLSVPLLPLHFSPSFAGQGRKNREKAEVVF